MENQRLFSCETSEKLSIFISLVQKYGVTTTNKMWPQNKHALVLHNTVIYFD